MGYLTGGLYQDVEISRQETPGAFDANGELLPCGLLRQESQIPSRVYVRGSRLFLLVYLYQRDGLGEIESARHRIYELLHDQQIQPSGGGCWRVRHANDLLDMEEPVLGARMMVSRYEAVVLR